MRGFSNIHILLLVAVLALVGLFYSGKLPLGSQTSSPTQKVDQVDETANWNTFTAPYKSYSFKYPKEWYAENPSDPNGVSFFETGVTPKHSTSGVFGNEVLVTIDYTATTLENLKSRKLADGSFDYTEITIGNKPSLKHKSTNSADILLNHLSNGNDRILNLRLLPDQNNRVLLDQILSTFKFNDTVQTDMTTNWKTYTSARAPYSFKYPDQQWPIVDITSTGHGFVEALKFSPAPNPKSGDTTLGVIFAFKESSIKSIDDYVNQHIQTDSSKVNLQYTTIGGEKAVSYTLSGGIPPLPIIQYAVYKNGYYYELWINDSAITNKDRQDNLNIFKNIISTFKFN